MPETISLLEDAVRLFKSALDIAPFELVFEQKIAALLFMHQRRRRAERLAAVVDVRQRLIADIDKIDRSLGRAQTFAATMATTSPLNRTLSMAIKG